MKAPAPVQVILGALARLAARFPAGNAERAARKALGMAARHPERITRELSDRNEEWLAELASGLWPDDEYTAIIAETRSRIFGAVQPRTCLNRRKVCSRSKRRKNACHSRSTSCGAAPATEDHSHAGLGVRSPGRSSTCSLIGVPSMTGSGPS